MDTIADFRAAGKIIRFETTLVERSVNEIIQVWLAK